MEKSYGACLEKWGFERTRDPFGESYPYEKGFWATPNKDIKRLEFLLNGVREQKRVFKVLVQGEYGTGKTYTLYYLKSYIERALDGLSIYITAKPKQ